MGTSPRQGVFRPEMRPSGPLYSLTSAHRGKGNFQQQSRRKPCSFGCRTVTSPANRYQVFLISAAWHVQPVCPSPLPALTPIGSMQKKLPLVLTCGFLPGSPWAPGNRQAELLRWAGAFRLSFASRTRLLLQTVLEITRITDLQHPSSETACNKKCDCSWKRGWPSFGALNSYPIRSKPPNQTTN